VRRAAEAEDTWLKEKDSWEEAMSKLESKLGEVTLAHSSASTAKEERLTATESELGEALARAIYLEA